MTLQLTDSAIKLSSGITSPYTKERNPRCQVVITTLTSDAITQYYPEYKTGGRLNKLLTQTKEKIETGKSLCVLAKDPDNGKVVCTAWVDCERGNTFSIATALEYRRRGIAEKIIRNLQSMFSQLTLDNSAGEVGKALYTKLGFTSLKDNPDRMIWKKTS